MDNRQQRRRGPFRVALARGDFRRVVLALTVSQAGDWLYNVGFLVYIFERTHSAGWVAAGTIVRLLPYVIAGPIGGAIADRYPRRRVMVSSDLTRAACMFLLAAAAATPVTPILGLALAFLATLAGTPYRPAVAKTTPTVVPESELAAANAAISAIGNIAIVIGPAIGGGLLLLGPPYIAFAVNGASFVLGAVAVARIKAMRSDEHQPVEAGGIGHVGQEVRDGVRALLSSGGAVVVVSFVAAGEFVYGAMTVLLVLASERKLGTGSEGYGYLLAALGLGGVLAVSLAARIAARSRVALPMAVALVCGALPLSAIAFVTAPLYAFLILVVAGAGYVVVEVVSVTLLQRALPAELLGRVFGIYDALDVGSILLGALVAPVLVALFNLDIALIVAGATLPLLPLAGLPAMRRLGEAAAARADQLAPSVELLARSGIFEGAPRTALELLASRAVTLDVAPGTTVIRQGEPAEHLYVVVKGYLDVVFSREPGAPPVTVNTLTDGDYFGEIGLLQHVPRTATVSAVMQSRLLRIDGQDFLDAVNQAPALPGMLQRGMTVRLARTTPAPASPSSR